MKIFKWLDDNSEELSMVVLMVGITVVLVLQIIMRYVFHQSLSWAEEISRYMLIWSGFLSISLTLKKGNAMKLDFLSMILPPKGKKLLFLIAQFVMLIFFIYLDIAAFQLLPTMQQKSAALLMPMKWVFVAVNIGFTLTLIRLLQLIIKGIRNFNKDELQVKSELDKIIEAELAELKGGDR